MKIKIKFNNNTAAWTVLINNTVFLNLFINKHPNKFTSKFINSYLVLLKILRQFGLKKPLKIYKNF